MRHNHTSLSSVSMEPQVPSVSDAEAREMEAWFVGRAAAVLTSRCEPLGLRAIAVEGNSTVGWELSAALGDGRPVSVRLELSDLLGAPGNDVDPVLAMFAERLNAAADLVLHPPEPPASDGPMMGLDSVGVQLGQEILDRLGQSGLERVRSVIAGDEVHEPGPPREFVPAGLERKS